MGEHVPAHLRAIYDECYPAGVVHGGPGQVELPVDGGAVCADLPLGLKPLTGEHAAHLRSIYGKCLPAGVVQGGPGQVE